MLVITLVLLYFLTADLCGAKECMSRDYGEGSTVCVCTSKYCDTVPQPERVDQSQYIKYTSNKAGLRFKSETGVFERISTGINPIVIESEPKFQTILGWGGAFSDATGFNIHLLEDDLQETLLKSYFSEDGIEYSLCRVPIGGTDFSLRAYSYDDGDVDEELINFRLAPEDYDYKMPYIKKAVDLTKGNLRLFGSAWTAPKWMQTNGDQSGPGYIIDSLYQTWADYFVTFLDRYQNLGMQFWGITTGNEPSLVAMHVPINAVGWNSSQMATWILNNLGPALRNSVHSDIKLMILDDQSTFLPSFVDEALADNTTSQYVDGIAFHWYRNNANTGSRITETHEHFPDKFILSTEACNGVEARTGPALGSWEQGEKYSNDIIQDLQNWVSGWVDWNMVLDLTGGPTYVDNFVNAPVIINATAGEFYKQPMYYHLGHFSKFIPRDSTRLYTHTSILDQNITSVAFQRPDNSTVIVILNRKDEVVPVTIVDQSRGVAPVELSERSITTLLYW